ncbi:MAG TPA: cytochrome c oxidase subunit I [Trueperaceae bacterium]|nr:cytochrome c oxidase subunit I [Trueperaceae bacterium]
MASSTTAPQASLFVRPNRRTGLVSWLTTVDHKKLGILYILSSFAFLGLASVEAFIMRLQLMQPGQQLVSPDVFNQLFTMHGVTMVFLAIMPMGIGFANYFVPLLIGARDLAFPRLNAFGYWVYALGGLMIYTSFFLGGAPDMGWTGYAPLTSLSANPGHGVDFYAFGLFISGIGTTVTAMNLIVTIVNMRAPGMTFMRMPVFVWMMIITSFMIIFAFPPLTIALVQIITDRTFGTLFYVPEAGALPILWQHLFWIFGHPEVYIIILPAFGMISEMVPTFSRKPLFGYPVMILASILIAFMGFAVWTHHMFTTGLGPVVNTAFSLTSFIIGIPTGVKIFNWLGTLWGGNIRFTTSLLYCLAFIVTFTLGGITGIMVAMPTFDAQVHDTYFVVAHFHYVMGGGALLTFLGAVYYWFPKFTGRLLDERMGKAGFVFIVLGFHTIFFPQHLAGLMGMPRRIQTYPAGIGLELWNFMSTFGTFIMGVGLVIFLINVIHGFRAGKPAGNDPWDGRTLEWATSSPPPYYNFATQPVVNSLDAYWAYKHPETLNVEPIDPRTEGREYDAGGIHIPGQSWWPILASSAIIVGSYGLIYDNWILAIISGFVFIFTIFGWAFEGVGGHHVNPELEGGAA